MKPAILLAPLAALILTGCSNTPPTVTRETTAPAQTAAPASGQLRYAAPDGWVAEQPTSTMRRAQYRLPRADGDPEDAELVVFYFGPGQGGSVQANLDRWVGQMQQPDGSSSASTATTKVFAVNGMNVTLLDVTGTYTAEMTPGAGDRHNKSGYRMRAAVVETPGGPYFIKLVGPGRTVARWEQSVDGFIGSFSFG